MSNQLETLKKLKTQVEYAISYIESGLPMKDLTLDERRRYQLDRKFFYDMIIGDFGITTISECKTCRPRWENHEKEIQEKD